MSIQDLSFDSFISNNKNNYCELIDNNNYLENLDFDFSFIENKLIEKEINKKLFEREITNNIYNNDSCITNSILYNNNKTLERIDNKETQIKFISKKEILDKNAYNDLKLIYRKDAYYSILNLYLLNISKIKLINLKIFAFLIFPKIIFQLYHINILVIQKKLIILNFYYSK